MKENTIIKYLKCPCCNAEMLVSDDGKTLACLGERRHCYDFSSKGYINLAGSRGVSGDSKEAVVARSDFLNKGYYSPIADTLLSILTKYKKNGLVVDAGCGEGYYTKFMADAGFDTMGIDLSKFAIQSTASRLKCKTAPNAFAAVASVFEIPIKDRCADAVVSIFAPCADKEVDRVLSDDGVLVVVSAGREHLMGLKQAIYDTAYENEERADMPKNMMLVEEKSLVYDITVNGNNDILNLFSMTPYYWRTSSNDKDKLSGLETLKTRIDINFFVYKKEQL